MIWRLKKKTAAGVCCTAVMILTLVLKFVISGIIMRMSYLLSAFKFMRPVSFKLYYYKNTRFLEYKGICLVLFFAGQVQLHCRKFSAFLYDINR